MPGTLSEHECDQSENGDRTRLRILMVAPQPFFRPRGTPFSVLHRIRALLEAGHRIDLITYPFGENVEMPGLRAFRCGKPFFIRDVRIGPSPTKLLLDLYLYRMTVRALREGQYDVLHSHEEAAFFAVRLARRHGLQHVYDMHSSLPHQLSNFRAYDLGLIRRCFSSLEQYVLRTCDGVITICPELAEIVARECPEKLHEMIENTADNSRVFGTVDGDPRSEHGLSGKKIVLYTGTFEAYQGLDLLMRAFGRLRPNMPDAHLLMVGGREVQVAQYKKAARSLGIEDAVTFVNTVHPSHIPGFLRATDIIVSPRSRGTNTPLKIYEYMRSMAPLVATDLPTHTQVLDASLACLVPATEEGLAAGMFQVLSDPELGQRLAQAAAERAEQSFSDAAYLEKVSAFYDRLIGSRQVGPARAVSG